MSNVATTIAQQLGGTNKLSAMIGANGFVASEDSLKFSFKGCRKGNMLRVTLNADDTYTVEMFKYNRRTFECPCVKSLSGVYADMLTSVFESWTGLYTSL